MLLAQPVQLGLKASKATPGQQETLVILVILVPQERPVRTAFRGSTDCKAQQALRETKVILVPQATRVIQERPV